MALASADFHTARGYGGMCPQFNLAFSLEEAQTFGRGSSPSSGQENSDVLPQKLSLFFIHIYEGDA
jgi:hypothetical protein